MFDNYNFFLKSLFLLGLAIFSTILISAYAEQKPARKPQQKVNILFERPGHHTLNLRYEFSRPLNRVNMGALISTNDKAILPGPAENYLINRPSVINDFRAREWTISNRDFQFEKENGFLFIARKDGTSFSNFSLTLPREHHHTFSGYRPVTNFKDAGGVIYTGFFQPFSQKSLGNFERMAVRYDFSMSASHSITEYGLRHKETNTEHFFEVNRENHPMFFYIGPSKSKSFSDVSILVDQNVPAWIEAELNAMLPVAKAYLQTAFQYEFDDPVSLFTTTPDISDNSMDGHSFHGDALPRQILIRLNGQGWAIKSERGVEVLRKNILHELIHLWQLRLRLSGALPDWVHEGAAEAISSEAMSALGYWNRSRLVYEKKQAQNNCSNRISGRSLREADETGFDRVSYYCGQMLAEIAAAGTEGTQRTGANLVDIPVTKFWRKFMEISLETGYSYENWLGYIRAHETRPGFARAIDQFVKSSALVHQPKIDHLYSLTKSYADIDGRER